MAREYISKEGGSESNNNTAITGTDDELWFKAKRFGWGWSPSNWKGWLVIGLAVAIITLMAIGTDFNNKSDMMGFFVKEGIVIAVLLLICWKKGEKPRWRWRK